MAYTICNDGVKQDHRGRKFRLARYPNGKIIEVPYLETGTKEMGYTIPVPKEPVRRPLKPLPTYTDPKTGEKRRVLHVPRRLHVVEVREGVEQHKFVQPPPMLLAALQPLVRLNGGKVAEILQPSPFDYHNQYHIDEEVK